MKNLKSIGAACFILSFLPFTGFSQTPESGEDHEIFKAVDEMPRFPGCEDLPTQEEKEQCAQANMLQFVYQNVKYPAIAVENGVEGTVVIRFIVEADGRVSNIELARDIGGGCGQEGMRVVNMMPNWIPGKQEGETVRVQYNLPIKFKLTQPKKSKLGKLFGS